MLVNFNTVAIVTFHTYLFHNFLSVHLLKNYMFLPEVVIMMFIYCVVAIALSQYKPQFLAFIVYWPNKMLEKSILKYSVSVKVNIIKLSMMSSIVIG
jgi:hypothetical protein